MQKTPSETHENWQVTGRCSPDKYIKNTRPILSKTSIAYWKEHVFKTKFKGEDCPNYSARISYKGKRVSFRLATPDKERAARRAVEIYRAIADHGWEHAIEIHRPDLNTNETDNSNEKGSTVGDLITHAVRLSDARPQTLQTYIKAFRRIVSELEGLSIPGRFYGPAHRKWVASVDKVRLCNITPERITAWRKLYVSRHADDAQARKSASTTVNSCIRNSKALFSRKLLPLLSGVVELPSPLPFEGISQLNAGTSRYQSKIDARQILDRAEDQLRHSNPSAYLILQLALRCGLRVSEIDHLLWSSIDLQKGVIHIQSTEYHQPKSQDSEGSIDLSEQTIAMLREFLDNSIGKFVIESADPPTTNNRNRRYRCRKALASLRHWLKTQGVTAKKPIHELRKEVGSVIAEEHGIFAASRFLRHSNIQITSDYYLDKKSKVIPSF